MTDTCVVIQDRGALHIGGGDSADVPADGGEVSVFQVDPGDCGAARGEGARIITLDLSCETIQFPGGAGRESDVEAIVTWGTARTRNLVLVDVSRGAQLTLSAASVSVTARLKAYTIPHTAVACKVRGSIVYGSAAGRGQNTHTLAPFDLPAGAASVVTQPISPFADRLVAYRNIVGGLVFNVRFTAGPDAADVIYNEVLGSDAGPETDGTPIPGGARFVHFVRTAAGAVQITPQFTLIL